MLGLRLVGLRLACRVKAVAAAASPEVRWSLRHAPVRVSQTLPAGARPRGRGWPLTAVCCCDVVEAVVREGGVGIDGLRSPLVRIRGKTLLRAFHSARKGRGAPVGAMTCVLFTAGAVVARER